MKEHLLAYFDSVKIYIIIQIIAMIIPFIVGVISEFCTNDKIKRIFKIAFPPVELLSGFVFGYCSGVFHELNPIIWGVIFVILLATVNIIGYIIFKRKTDKNSKRSGELQ